MRSAILRASVLLAVVLALKKLWRERKKARARESLRAVSGGKLPVAIIGAGFGGLLMAIKLKELGRPYVIIERQRGVGGVWLANSYPGAACDVPICAYSVSFEQRGDWKHNWEGRDSILSYIKSLYSKHRIGENIRFGVSVSACRLERKVWKVRLSTGEELNCSAVISATGQLSNRVIPDIVGRKTFKGRQVHTADWPSPSGDVEWLRGKRVVCVGTGASAMQCLPLVAKVAKELTVLQSSPAWIIPRPMSNDLAPLLRRLLLRSAWVRGLYRFASFAILDLMWALVVPNNATEQTWGNRMFQGVVERLMRKQCNNDPALCEKLIPKYPIGCKRLLVSSAWVGMFLRENVTLVASKIARVTETEAVTASGVCVEADAIIWATGFDTNTFARGIEIFNSSGAELHEEWGDTAKAFFGIAVPGFANFFMIYGPGTNVNHSSIITMLESQCEHIAEVLTKTTELGRDTAAVKADVASQWASAMQGELGKSVFNADCDSWYKRNSRREIVNNWPASIFGFKKRIADVRVDATYNYE